MAHLIPRSVTRLSTRLTNSSSALRPVSRSPAFTSLSARRYAGSSYGGGEGDPKGENPLEQGPNPSEHLEHPGPPPPSVVKGSNNGSNSGNSDSSSGSKDGNQGLSGQSDSASRGPKGGAQPKILDSAPPQQPAADVEQHNKEFEQRHDRAANKINPDGKDNVGKGFWSGELDFLI